MATYKVIQDIEAEDKLIGPLSLKQFIFAGIAAGFLFAAFMVATRIAWWGAIPFIPFIAVPAILAAPYGKDQPTEIWLAAQIRFFIKPRKRIWDQTGIKELVNITVPKKVEKVLVKGYSQQEVKSRLQALANTIDSRGWAVKNVDVNMYSPPMYNVDDSDRLVDLTSLPKTVPEIDINASDDIMDYQNNSVAHHFDEMVHSATNNQRQIAINRMKDALHKTTDKSTKKHTTHTDEPIAPPQQTETTSNRPIDDNVTNPLQSAQPTPQSLDDNQNDSAADDNALLAHIQEEKLEEEMIKPHHKTIKTAKQIAAEEDARQKVEQAQAELTPKNPDIIEYAKTDDLSVASIAHLANRKTKKHSDEVVVHLR